MSLFFIALLAIVVFPALNTSKLLVNADALHPIRHDTEEAFFKAKSHERTMNSKEMAEKIKKMRDRRKHKTWDPSNPSVVSAIAHPPIYQDSSLTNRTKRPNILFMLADDLGYGDLSVYPFVQEFNAKEFPCTEGGILSPNLERMAANGITMTNFHSAAPVCSPARAAIMTGLYSWRVNAMNAFELGKDMSQRNGFLPQIPTIAELLREEGYYTIHSGKWHLGGMREELRLERANKDQCSRPSPNQHGFEEYISELDGPESPRYTFLLRNANLHTQGHRHLIADDIPVPTPTDNTATVLSDREAQDALDLISLHSKKHPDQPWFAQIWFNAPHGPWEILKTGEEIYSKHYNRTSSYWEGVKCPYQGKDYPLYSQNWFYKTMVSAMDTSIGRVLDTINSLNLDRETLIIFTSDNGNELGAGTGGIFKDGKRSLMEGGIRIPTIMQWIGTIPARSYSSYFAGHTDLLPTCLEVAGIDLNHENKNKHSKRKLFFDGVSILPALTRALPSPTNLQDLLQPKYHVSHGQVPGDKEIRERLARHWQRYPELLPPVARPQSGNHTSTISTSTSRRDRRRDRRRRLETSNTNNNKLRQNQQMAKHRIGIPQHPPSHHSPTQQHRQPPPPPPPSEPVEHQDETAVTAITTGNSSSSSVHKGHSLGLAHVPPTNRIFLWHKDTDPYRAQEQRQQAGGYFETVKILTSGPRHCIDRIFDLAADPFEHRNLLKGPYTTVHNCRLSIASVDVNMIRSALTHGDLDSNVIVSHCKLSDSSAEDDKELCKVHYINILTAKIMTIIRKLLPFVRDGKRGHDKYMSETADKATCTVPVASMIEPLDYLTDKGCESHRFGCSEPEY